MQKYNYLSVIIFVLEEVELVSTETTTGRERLNYEIQNKIKMRYKFL